MSTCVSPTRKTPTELLSVFGLALGLLGSAASEVSASCAEDFARSVQAHYDSVRDFKAEFEQTTRSVLFGGAGDGLSAPLRGEVVFAKPGKMRWSYTEPEASLVVSDGQLLWIYSPERKEAQRLPVPEGYLTGAALQFLLGDGKLLESFKVTSEVGGLQGGPLAGLSFAMTLRPALDGAFVPLMTAEQLPRLREVAREELVLRREPPTTALPTQFEEFDLCQWRSGKARQARALREPFNANLFELACSIDGLPESAFPGTVCCCL